MRTGLETTDDSPRDVRRPDDASQRARDVRRTPRSTRPRILRRTLRAGFSVVELLAVIVVLGLIATIVTVNWQDVLPSTELHSAVRELASALQGTRSDAIARNAVFRLEYDVDHDRYRVSTPYKQGGGRATLATSDEDRVALPWTVLPENVHFHRIQIDGEEYTQGIVYVRFDPLGAASTHAITLIQKPYDTYYTIEVQGLTGLIDYHEGLFAREVPKESDFQ